MMSFRKRYEIRRRQAGRYEAGEWLEGGLADAEPILASVQAVSFEQLRDVADGRRVSAAVRIYTDAVLQVAGESDSGGDVLLYRGRQWQVIAVDARQSDVLNHFKYLAVADEAIV